MSPPGASFGLTLFSAPRVSGDEPGRELAYNILAACSPRERG